VAVAGIEPAHPDAKTGETSREDQVPILDRRVACVTVRNWFLRLPTPRTLGVEGSGARVVVDADHPAFVPLDQSREPAPHHPWWV